MNVYLRLLVEDDNRAERHLTYQPIVADGRLSRSFVTAAPSSTTQPSLISATTHLTSIIVHYTISLIFSHVRRRRHLRQRLQIQVLFLFLLHLPVTVPPIYTQIAAVPKSTVH